tara:strand:+ start:18223 stop:19389 length:1167 start_codon:yes stop_codon:yes gene_type:complete
MKKKVCVLTGARSEYGLLKPLISELDISDYFNLELAVTGSHLSDKHGFTLEEILRDGFKVSYKVEILSGRDSRHAINQAISRTVNKFSQIFENSRPDLLIVLGDRYEALGGAISAMVHNIPIAHIHGGEVTEGAIDEAIRHSLTKMSFLHFVATEKYRNRVIQLGEDPKRVFNVGGMALDSIQDIQYLSKDQLEDDLSFKFKELSFLVTYHPVTLDKFEDTIEIDTLLRCLESFPDASFLFTMPNADPGNKVIRKRIKNFVKHHNSSIYVESLGQQKFLSCLSFVDGIIGNSSSGLLEAPNFNIGTINIGDRQKGRERAASVIDVQAKELEIVEAMNKIISQEFKDSIKLQKNPYGVPGASKKIINIIQDFFQINKEEVSLVKRFRDL